MKRIVALLLALIMALSATLALAEPAQTPNDGLVLVSSVNIDRDKAAQIMDELKLDEKTRKLVDSALAVVNAATDQLIIAENGVRYEVFLNETEVFCFTLGKNDEGLVVLSNLIPGHALTVSNDSLDVASGVLGIVSEITRGVRAEKKAEEYRAREAMKPYITEFVMDVLSAIRIGEEEKGEFVLQNGKTYNTSMKISFDRQGIADALNNMFTKIQQDSLILTILVNTLLTDEDLANSAFVTENIPAIDIALYANLDDKGEELSPEKAFAATLTLPGQTEAYATLELHQVKDSVEALLNIPGTDGKGGISAAFGFVPYDREINGSSAKLEVNINGDYYGDVFTIGLDEEKEALNAENTLYIQDPDKPLAVGRTAIQSGVQPLDLSIGDRHIVPLESLLIGEESKKLEQALTGEVVLSGLSIIGTATKAVPEFADLLALLNSAMTEAAAQVEEPETAKDAA